MLRAPARGASPTLATLVLLAVALGATGCGGDDEASADDGGKAPDRATTACRGQWKDLEAQVGAKADATTPSTLPERWNSIEATVEYYAVSAEAKDCDTTLAAQKRSLTALTAFSKRLTPYDMELRLSGLEDDAAAYARMKQAPVAKPARKGRKAVRGPKPARVRADLRTLTKQAPLATKQQGPAWTQASAVDLEDKASVKKALKDLAFLSDESAAYRAANGAAGRLRAAVRLVD